MGRRVAPVGACPSARGRRAVRCPEKDEASAITALRPRPSTVPGEADNGKEPGIPPLEGLVAPSPDAWWVEYLNGDESVCGGEGNLRKGEGADESAAVGRVHLDTCPAPGGGDFSSPSRRKSRPETGLLFLLPIRACGEIIMSLLLLALPCPEPQLPPPSRP